MTSYLLAIAMQDKTNVERGLEAMETLKSHFAYEGVPGYAESIEPGKPRHPVFNWGVGVLLSAMNVAAIHSPKWKDELRRFTNDIPQYWNAEGPVPGFDVLPGAKKPDRYYDDNAWMVMALLDASNVLGSPMLFALAHWALTFALSGEDDKLGGGIYWRESDKKSKNTCSNAPTVAACLAMYETTNDAKFLDAAKRIYAWTRANLQDPSDKLYWDSIDWLGRVDKTKWSYNSALMVRSSAVLYRVTKELQYMLDAEETAKASEAKWLVNGRLADVGRFAHLLAESWSFVPSDDRKAKVRQALEWLYKNGKNKDGLYANRFDRVIDPGQTKFDLLDQASAARAFLVAP